MSDFTRFWWGCWAGSNVHHCEWSAGDLVFKGYQYHCSLSSLSCWASLRKCGLT